MTQGPIDWHTSFEPCATSIGGRDRATYIVRLVKLGAFKQRCINHMNDSQYEQMIMLRGWKDAALTR